VQLLALATDILCAACELQLQEFVLADSQQELLNALTDPADDG